jgi:hypothetical protein
MGQRIYLETNVNPYLVWGVVDSAYLGELSGDIDAVVDLGSGAGVTLLRLALFSARRDVQFFGGEIAVNGQRTLEALANIAGLSNVKSVALDFLNPNFEFLRGYKKVLVISYAALVYGKDGARTLWERLFATVPSTKAALFEQVSYSIPGRSQEPLFTASMAAQSGHDPALLPTLVQLAKAGVIEMKEMVPDIVGLGWGAAVSLIRFETC